jgi:uncharacterized cupin superfamily protein
MPFLDPSEVVRGSPLEGWSGPFFHSENMTFAYWDIASGAADLHDHHHEQEEVWQVMEGRIALSVDGDERRLGPGMAAVVPANTRHAARVLGPCRALVADYPLRLELPGGAHRAKSSGPVGAQDGVGGSYS